MHCSNCRNVVTTAGLSFWKISDHSFNLFATDCIYLVLHLTHFNDIIYSSVFILIQFFHILSPSLHYFIFSIKTFPCLLLIVCNPLFPFGRSSLIFWYINWLCALSNISISLHLSS